MTNPVIGEALLTLKDKREFTLVLDHEALIAAESAYGKPLAQVLFDADLGFLGAARALLYGALREHHPDLSLKDAGTIFMADGTAVSAALEAASKAAFPDVQEDKKPGKGRPPRGKSDGPNGAKSD